MGITEQFAVLVAGLSNQNEVFAVSGERDGTALAEHVHALAATGEQQWEVHIDPREPAVDVAQVGSALRSVPRELAERRLAALTSRSIVYTYDVMDGDRARELAGDPLHVRRGGRRHHPHALRRPAPARRRLTQPPWVASLW
ncbi:hypothetical protein [Amycolatopsis pretoriensis]|uniref:hypothetical protein n=1 Tax=Amycolatopsis pretoriensis TaxID=218821 RepID=UPI00115FAA18|nr:hypothetical protein [Amycolatopsis pretoriensis]